MFENVQTDILAHKSTKLFISHCGLLSTQETYWYEVPVLEFPVIGDQMQNAFRLKKKRVCKTLSIMDFIVNEPFETSKKLLEDPKYMISISTALRDQPMSPLKEATFWTKWVLRHSDIDLSTPSNQLSMFVRHSLDVYTLLLAFFTLATFQ